MMRAFLFIALVALSLSTPAKAGKIHVLEHTAVVPGSHRSSLVVLLHGYTLDGQSLESIQAIFTNGHPAENASWFNGSDLLRPEMPLGTFSTVPPSEILAELLLMIDDAWRASIDRGQPYKRIVLIGHSMGGLFARKLYVAACGETKDAPFEPDLHRRLRELGAAPLSSIRPWAHDVERIVLLAGMNRGWSIDHHMSIPRAIMMQAGVALGHVLTPLSQHPPLIFAIRRGSPFLTQLRLQWLAMRQKSEERGIGAALTVQLLGTVDDLVSPEDNVDSIVGDDFYYMEVPFSGHGNVIEMDDTPEGQARRHVLVKALALDLSADDSIRAVPPLQRDMRVTDVLFVIHGIRDEGFWTRKIAQRTQSIAEKDGYPRVFATETSSYGYFPMLSFLRPGAREAKVAWLMERYAEAKARYPNARNFHYVGHSHGTYLLAKALRDYPAVHFKQVVFAGSVVEKAFEWQDLVPERVESVVNFVATADWVVAFFPNAIQMLGLQDLGSAGHDGFDYEKPPEVANFDYVVGGHGAALNERMWDTVARYIVEGKLSNPPNELVHKKQALWVTLPAKIAWAIPLLILAAAAWGLVKLFRWDIREWKKTLLIVTYLGIIWIVLTEV